MQHPRVQDLLRVSRNSRVLNDKMRQWAVELSNQCACRNADKTKPRSRITVPLGDRFNHCVAVDIVYMHDSHGRSHPVLTMVDAFTRYTICEEIRGKETAAKCWELFAHHWLRMGRPRILLSDNGSSFRTSVQ